MLISETKIKSVSLSSLNEGINILDNHIINYLDGDVKYLIDKNGNLDLSNIPNGKYIYNGAVIEF